MKIVFIHHIVAGVLLTSATTKLHSATNAEQTLLQLANERFTNDLTVAEKKLFQAAAVGGWADCATESDGDINPGNSAQWSTNRLIRANRLAWLCTDRVASTLVNHWGIAVRGARIDGILNLSWAKIEFPLRIVNCTFTSDILLQSCSVRALELAGTHIRNFRGDRLVTEDYLKLHDEFQAEGIVRIAGGAIGGQFICRGRFLGDGENALIADTVKVGGDISLKTGFSARGTVRLLAAMVGRDLNCDGGEFIGSGGVAIDAQAANISGRVFMRDGFRAEGEVRLSSTKIGSDLACIRGKFFNTNDVALRLERANVAGTVYLGGGFQTAGAVLMNNAVVSGDLDCMDGRLFNTNSVALAANTAVIRGSVFMAGKFRVEGEVQMAGATIERWLMCSKGEFINPGGRALTVEGATIKGGVLLLDMLAEGEVNFQNAGVGLNLNGDGARLTAPSASALNVEGAQIGGSVFLRRIGTTGEVRLGGAVIGGDVDFEDSQLWNSTNYALMADKLMTKGNVSLNGKFKAEGTVRLLAAKIEGDLNAEGGTFRNLADDALALDDARIDGNLFLRNGFNALGEVRLLGAMIGGDFEAWKGDFTNPGTNALSARNATIGGRAILRDGFRADGRVSFLLASAQTFEWRGIKDPDKVVLDLRSARVGSFIDEKASWPKAGNLLLRSFVYDEISAVPQVAVAERLNWLRLQPTNAFLHQPYEQYAAVLTKMGHEDDATVVMIAKNQDYARHSAGWSLWYDAFGKLIGYGYETWRAFLISWVFIGIGSAIFWWGRRKDILLPVDDDAYSISREEEIKIKAGHPVFNPFIYSLETFVPLVKLGMGDYWLPRANRKGWISVGNKKVRVSGSVVRCYLWLHILAGWVLTTLWVASLAGLVKT